MQSLVFLMNMRSNVTYQQNMGFKAYNVSNVIYRNTSGCGEKSYIIVQKAMEKHLKNFFFQVR